MRASADDRHRWADGQRQEQSFPASFLSGRFLQCHDRAAELNHGSFHKISAEIRNRVNIEFQDWIGSHIDARRSFAIETTLNSAESGIEIVRIYDNSELRGARPSNPGISNGKAELQGTRSSLMAGISS
jgi:hypothetical protein